MTGIDQDGMQGVLLDKHDSESAGMAIETLVSDWERLPDMSVAAIQRVKEQYGVERLTVQFDRLYRELLA